MLLASLFISFSIITRMCKNQRPSGQALGGGEVVAEEVGVVVACEGVRVGVQEEGGDELMKKKKYTSIFGSIHRFLVGESRVLCR